jgi:hypothetical protein
MNLVANTANVVAETFKSPNEESFIYLESGRAERASKKGVAPAPSGGRPPTPLKPAFKWALITVVGITVLSGIATIVLAGVWTHPTPNQQSTFEAFGFAWKAGIGAIFGLIGGKVT